MSKATFTDGTEIVFNFQCDCGLTGGCEKCQPHIKPSPKYVEVNFDIEEPLSPDLKEFYRRKGYKII